MKKTIIGIVSIVLLAAGCGSSSPAAENKQTPPAGQSQQSTTQQPATNNQQTNPMTTKNNSVLGSVYIASYKAVTGSSFENWFATIDSPVSKEEFIKEALAGNPFGYTTIDQAWPKVSQKINEGNYMDPSTCTHNEESTENYQGKDFGVYYCSTATKAIGVYFEKYGQNWLLTGTQLAQKDSQGQITYGGGVFSGNTGSKSLATVSNHLKEILQK